MRQYTVIHWTSSWVAALLLAGCSATSQPATPASNQSSGSPAAMVSQALNGCSSYADFTDSQADRLLKWDFAITSNPNRCMKIKQGQSVTFAGNFTQHPLQALGGDNPNPFTQAAGAVQNAGQATEQTSVRFDTPGIFGYKCSVHASMTGAIVVVP